MDVVDVLVVVVVLDVDVVVVVVGIVHNVVLLIFT